MRGLWPPRRGTRGVPRARPARRRGPSRARSVASMSPLPVPLARFRVRVGAPGTQIGGPSAATVGRRRPDQTDPRRSVNIWRSSWCPFRGDGPSPFRDGPSSVGRSSGYQRLKRTLPIIASENQIDSSRGNAKQIDGPERVEASTKLRRVKSARGTVSMRMKTCPRCDSSLDDEARYCVAAAPKRRTPPRNSTSTYSGRPSRWPPSPGGRAAGGGDFGNDGGGTGNDGGGSGFVPTEQLTDREQLWAPRLLRLRLRDDSSSRSRWSRRSVPSPDSRRDRDLAADPPPDRGAAREPAETRGDGRAVRGIRAARRRAARGFISHSRHRPPATRSETRPPPPPR